MPKFWTLIMILAIPVLSGCALAAGAGGALIADEAVEQEQGGDGLF